MESKMKLKKQSIIILIVILTIIAGIAAFLLIRGDKDPETTEEVVYVTITFDADGGSEVESKKIKQGEKLILPESEKEGYVLVGWYDEEEEVTNKTKYTKDTLLKAKWEELKTFKISFDSKGGSKVKEIEAICNKKIELPEEPTKDGFTFVKWTDKKEKEVSDGDLLACEDITLYAVWDKEKGNNFKVYFDSKGGTKVSTITLECDKELTLPAAPTRDGYSFVAWVDKNGKAILDGAKLTCEDVVLYADWKEDANAKAATPTPEVTPTPVPATPTPSPEITPTPKPKEYTCTEGTLSGDKCLIEGTVRETCPEGTTLDESVCIKTSDSNSGTRQCKTYTVSIDGKGHTQTVKGDYYMVGNSYGKCAYYKWTDYTTQDQCTAANDINHKTTWVSEKNGCYAETYITFPSGESSYEIVCDSDYQYYSSDQLSSKFGIHDNAKCLKKVSKTKYCDENYTLTSGKCIKTVAATEK